MAMSQVHRPSALKQQNKKHKTLGHRTKGAITKSNKGRVSVKALTKKHKTELSREQRKNKNRQVRAQKREEAAARKRCLGSAHQPPFLVTIIPLSPDINPRTVLEALKTCDDGAVITTSTQGLVHISSSRYKQRFSFIIPPANDLFAILDSVKVSDTVMLLWAAEEDLSEAAESLISSILAQGLPTPIHIITGIDQIAQKNEEMDEDNLESELSARLSLDHQPSTSRITKPHRQQQAKQRLKHEIGLHFPGQNGVLMSVDRPQDALLVLRHIGQQRQRTVYYRDHRPHIMAECVQFIEEGSTGTLKVEGYVRGQELSVNSLIHIPGWGDYQMSRIDSKHDPHPLTLTRNQEINDDGTYLLEEADPQKQESLMSTNETDPMEGEQTYPTEEEINEAEEAMKGAVKSSKTRTKRVPKGTSPYQAAWIVDSDDEDKNVDDQKSVDDDDESAIMDNDELVPIDTVSHNGSQQDSDDDDDDDDDDDYETMTVTDAEGVNYDEKMDYAAEMDALGKLTAAREDAMFPDEIDTPQSMDARVRFQKFRGLQSFRTSPWNPEENLPEDYAKIFQFENFNRTRKRVVKDERDGVLPGWYVVIHISNVPRHLYDEHITTGSPLVLFSLLPHEQKMSVVNVVIKSHTNAHFKAIKSKERMIFHIGFRRFANCPIFSEHTNGNKHKFARYFHPGTTVVATMFAPITFPPVSVLMFRQRPDGAQDLVGTGSLMSVDPKRIITKRVVLSGHPFKVNRKTAVVRYMFFNREDVMWFKPVELRTKWGRRGHIKEPLGTHGHMKCYFDGQLKSQDTVLLNLYKRVFPKWTFDPYVSRPLPLYTYKPTYVQEEEEEMGGRRKEEEGREEIGPSKKRAKTVSFLSSN